MIKWVWEHEKFLKGTGRLVSFGSILSPDFVENLRFTINGKFESDAEISGMVSRILDKELGSWKGKNRFLPVSVFELILHALWRIKIRELKYLKFNDQNIYQDNYLFELCQRIHDGDKVNQLQANMNNDHQSVNIWLKFRNKNVKGELVFAKPIKERLLIRFTWSFNDISDMFAKEKLKPPRRGRRGSLLTQIFLPTKYQSGYSFYQLPSGFYLDSDGSFDGRDKIGGGGSWNPINATKK